MAPELQTKLLRFTQDRLLAPVGGLRPRRIETRIVAATSRTAPPAESGGQGLRADLAARLGAEPIAIPPLRERIEDLGALAFHLLGERAKPFELAAFQALCFYNWPGNVRELGKVVTSAEALARERGAHQASSTSRRRSRRRRAHQVVARARASIAAAAERGGAESCCERYKGNMLRVARELDRKPALVYRWAKRFGLDVDEFRDKAEE